METHWQHDDSPTETSPSRPGRYCGPQCDLFVNPDPRAAYECPVCGRLPHWSAVVLAYAALPQRLTESREQHVDRVRPAVVSLSADVCQRNAAQL